MSEQRLHEFLNENRAAILALTAEKALQLAGACPTSDQLKQGLPIFYEQLVEILRKTESTDPNPQVDQAGMAHAAEASDEPAMAKAAGRPAEASVAVEAGLHGAELQRLGYTLSHVVHAYGAMCQSITEMAIMKGSSITAKEFHDLNQCLDVAIAGAVTEFQSIRNTQDRTREVEHLGFLAHELRNALASASISCELIDRGTVGIKGSTGQVLKDSLKRMAELIDRSLTEIRLRVEPEVYAEPVRLVQIVDQIVVTADVEARARGQTLRVAIDPALEFEADQQLIYSALSNLVQNALKYTKARGRVEVRGRIAGEQVVIEVEDECGGLSDSAADLFKPFVQKHENRKGLGLGLTIARRAVELMRGKIELANLPGKGCVFTITVPLRLSSRQEDVKGAA